MEIELIDTGYFFADGGAMFGSVPKKSWSKRYASNGKNGCLLTLRSLLVQTACGRVILVDTGAGHKQLNLMKAYQFFRVEDLGEELGKRGLSRTDITDVVFTHLHFDHCGYATLRNKETNALELGFPNARHWVGESQWQNFLHPHPLEEPTYMRENVYPVFEQGRLERIEGETTLCPGVVLKLYDGHTPGQIVPYFDTSGGTFVFPGDVIPLAACVSPGWISAYDLSPKQSYDEKTRLLEAAVRDKQTLIFCHDAYSLTATVKKVGSFYAVDEVFGSPNPE